MKKKLRSSGALNFGSPKALNFWPSKALDFGPSKALKFWPSEAFTFGPSKASKTDFDLVHGCTNNSQN